MIKNQFWWCFNMKHLGNKVEDLKIAYIGGGSRGWAWGLMSDLAQAEDISGSVYLYDIDLNAAKNNEIIGNKVNALEGAKSVWNYKSNAYTSYVCSYCKED